MLGNKPREFYDSFNARIFGKFRTFETFIMSGNRSALPPTRPLRTVLASFPAHGSSKSLMCRATAVGVDKTQVPVGAVRPVPIPI